MDKQSIIKSLTALEKEGSISILSMNKESLSIWDNEDSKEIKFYFKEHFTQKNIAKKVFVSTSIPDRYKSLFSKEDIAEFLFSKADPDSLITMRAVFVLYDKEDEFGDGCDPYRETMTDFMGGDEYAMEIGLDTVGITWWERNTVIINARQIIEILKEMYDEDDYMFMEEVEAGLWTTLLHELRHLMLDTNIILPEDEYPHELASEEAVEEYCRTQYEKIRRGI